MSPFETPEEQARYDALVAEGKSPEDAHKQVEDERTQPSEEPNLVGSGEPTEPTPDAENETESSAEPEPEPEEPAGNDAEQAEPSTVAARDPETFDAPAQQRVTGSHVHTDEPGNARTQTEADPDDDRPLVADRDGRQAGEAEELPQATVPPSARSLPG